MTGSELKAQAEKYLSSTIDDADALQAINEALLWMGDLGLIYGTITVSATAGTFYTLPDELTKIIRVEDIDNNVYYYNYRLRGNDIAFKDAGNYLILARKMSAGLSLIDDEIDVHPALQRCIIDYVRAFVKLKDDDTNPDGLRLMAKFERDVQIMSNMLKDGRNRGPEQVRVMRHG